MLHLVFQPHSGVNIEFIYTGCPTTYQTQHFFNNSKTNEDIATRFEQEYVRCVRNEEECVCRVCPFRCNIFIGFRIIKEVPGLVGSGTPYIYILYVFIYIYIYICLYIFIYLQSTSHITTLYIFLIMIAP
jgi:hypothetical protein